MRQRIGECKWARRKVGMAPASGGALGGLVRAPQGLFWRARQDLNPRPDGSEDPSALSTELQARRGIVLSATPEERRRRSAPRSSAMSWKRCGTLAPTKTVSAVPIFRSSFPTGEFRRGQRRRHRSHPRDAGSAGRSPGRQSVVARAHGRHPQELVVEATARLACRPQLVEAPGLHQALLSGRLVAGSRPTSRRAGRLRPR